MILHLATYVAALACAVHIACLIKQEHARATLELESARYTHADLCVDAVRVQRYGRFHMCDDVLRTMSMTNVWMVAFDRALSGFFLSVKTQTFDDLTHIGLVSVLVAFAACLALNAASWASRLSSQQRQIAKERDYESPARRSNAQAAIKML